MNGNFRTAGLTPYLMFGKKHASPEMTVPFVSLGSFFSPARPAERLKAKVSSVAPLHRS